MVVPDHPSWAEVYQFFTTQSKKKPTLLGFFPIGIVVLSLARITWSPYDEESGWCLAILVGLSFCHPEVRRGICYREGIEEK